MREELDVYIHFVKEVSTLTPNQLDTPNPPIRVPATVFDMVPTNVATPATPSPITPIVGGADQSPDLILDVAFDQLSLEPRSSVFVNEPKQDATSDELRISPLSNRVAGPRLRFDALIGRVVSISEFSTNFIDVINRDVKIST